MKRILALLLAMIIILLLCACGNNTTENTDRDTTSNTESSMTGIEETADSAKQPDATTSDTDGTEESTTATEGTQAPTVKPNEQTKPTGGNKPTGNTTPTTTPPTTETKECQHTKAFNAPNDDTSRPVPTCTKNGYYLKYCPDCYKQWHEGATALGHSGGTASCKSRAKCTRCQQEYGELDNSNHIRISNIIRNAVPATCEKDGYEGDLSYCNDCGKTLTKGKTLKATGHSISTSCVYGENKLHEYCTNNCGYSIYKDLEPLNFTFVKIESLDGLCGAKFDITGGYGGSGGKYTADCYFYFWNGIKTQTDHKEYTNIKDDFSFLFAYISLNDTFTITVSDYYGHSKTKSFICIQDPSNPDKVTLRER